MAAKKWIRGAIGKPGALHEELHVPKGQRIPASLLAEAAKEGGAIGRQARLAETLEGFHHSPRGRAKAVTSAVKRGRRRKGH